MSQRFQLYFASHPRHVQLWRQYQDQLGPLVQTSWLKLTTPETPAQAGALCETCLQEASQAAVLVAYAEPDDVLRGTYAEIGACLAHGGHVLAVGLDPGLLLLQHPRVEQCRALDVALGIAVRRVRWLQSLAEQVGAVLAAAAPAPEYGEDSQVVLPPALP